ncbi:MAG: adenosylmethionine decarboxylase [Fimbriimonadaceae bacterium]
MFTILIIIVSSVSFGAIAISHESGNRSRIAQFFQNLFRFRSKPAQAVAYEHPRLRRDDGWQFIQSDDVKAFEHWLTDEVEGLPPQLGEEPSLGSHLLIELYGCAPETLEYEKFVGYTMVRAAHDSEATIVADSFHEFKPFGVSGAVIIQESHYTIHTWPEHGYAAVDLFYCGGTVKVNKALRVLRERFQPQRMKFLIVRRGLQSEVTRNA